jgi:hypothetical protein
MRMPRRTHVSLLMEILEDRRVLSGLHHDVSVVLPNFGHDDATEILQHQRESVQNESVDDVHVPSGVLQNLDSNEDGHDTVQRQSLSQDLPNDSGNAPVGNSDSARNDNSPRGVPFQTQNTGEQQSDDHGHSNAAETTVTVVVTPVATLVSITEDAAPESDVKGQGNQASGRGNNGSQISTVPSNSESASVSTPMASVTKSVATGNSSNASNDDSRPEADKPLETVSSASVLNGVPVMQNSATALVSTLFAQGPDSSSNGNPSKARADAHADNTPAPLNQTTAPVSARLAIVGTMPSSETEASATLLVDGQSVPTLAEFNLGELPLPQGADLLTAAMTRSGALDQAIQNFLTSLTDFGLDVSQALAQHGWAPWALAIGVGGLTLEWTRQRLYRGRRRVNLALAGDGDSLSWVPGLPGSFSQE